MFNDSMMDKSYISQLPKSSKTREKDNMSHDKFSGLHINVGVVYEVFPETLTVLLGTTPLTDTPDTQSFSELPTVEAMLTGNNIGAVFGDGSTKKEKFAADITLPSPGSHVLYAHINGAIGGPELTVVLGSFHALLPNYSYNTVADGIKAMFVDLNIQKLYESPTGYYWYEDIDGAIYEGFMDHTNTSDPKKKWSKEILQTGQVTHIIYNDADDSKKTYERIINQDGTYSVRTFDNSGAEISSYVVDAAGKVNINNGADGAARKMTKYNLLVLKIVLSGHGLQLH